LDLEGIVAKEKSAPYASDRESSTWFKILNRNYSQKQRREELFERQRHKEPVPGWHSCAVACGEVEARSTNFWSFATGFPVFTTVRLRVWSLSQQKVSIKE
jgi:ATP-dependent DNA ligase